MEPPCAPLPAAADRALLSLGASEQAIYELVRDTIAKRHPGGGVLLDVGCGTGNLWSFVGPHFDRYVGVDVVHYDAFPGGQELLVADLDRDALPLPDGHAHVAAAVETIEHLENPRRFVRELVRVTRPRGWIVVTTPNQRSLLSLMTLLVKGRFSAFQDVHYPAHLTALLEVDLTRIATECGLRDVTIEYSRCGRIVATPLRYPRLLSRLLPRACSDNLLVAGRKAE